MSNYLTYSDAFFASSADTMEYVIKQGDTYIFRGIAVKAPGADYAYIDVGKICRQYLDNNLPDFRDFNDQITRLPNALQKFTLSSVQHNTIWTGSDTYLDDVTEQVEEIYSFIFNWDYEGTADNEGMPLSDPVNGHMDCRMKLIYTQYGETTVKDFYVTPLLSSPVQGGTLTAKITTEYTDVSKLTVTVDNPDVVVQNYSLSGVTFVTPANNGKTVTTTAHYYYDGKLVGKTEIILAGEQGGDPETPDAPIIVDAGEAQIPGSALYSGGGGKYKDYIIRMGGNRSGSTLFSVYGSDYITGQTGNNDVVDLLHLVLIDDNTPAPLGDKVKVSITSNNITVQKEYTVTVRWNGLYGDGGVIDYWLVDTFSVEADTSPEDVGPNGASWGTYYNYLKFDIGGDCGGRWPNGDISSKHYCTASGNTIYSSMVIRFMEINEQLYTDNSVHFSSVTINSGITSLRFDKALGSIETITTSGVTDLYYNGTLAQWNSLENVDPYTWEAYHKLNYVEHSMNPKKLKLFRHYPTDINAGCTALTVHCSDGVTEWTTLPYITGDTIETYIDKIQIPGSEQASHMMQLKFENEDLIAEDLIVSDEYFTFRDNSHALLWGLSGGNAPLGHTLSGNLIMNWTYVGDVDFEVTSIFANTGDTVATQKIINETVGITASPVEVTVGASVVRLRYNNPPYAGTYVGCTISFNTLFAEKALIENYRQSIETASTDGSITVSKSAKNNTISIYANDYLKENVTVTLNATGYVGYYINDVASDYGVTDLYIADTVEWFSGLPSVKSTNGSGNSIVKSRWYRGISGKSITVHCTNGTFVWSPDETV